MIILALLSGRDTLMENQLIVNVEDVFRNSQFCSIGLYASLGNVKPAFTHYFSSV